MSQTDINIYNAIKTQGGNEFSSLPQAKSMSDLKQIGKDYFNNNNLLQNQNFLNAFLQTAMNKIGLSLMQRMSIKQPLEQFKGESMAYGDTIETIFVGMTSEKAYSFGDKTSPFDVTAPDVYTHYSRINRMVHYDTTISLVEIGKAFLNEGGLSALMSTFIDRLSQSNYRDEYLYIYNKLYDA